MASARRGSLSDTRTSTILLSTTEPPAGDGLERRQELGAVVHALLEQVRAAVRARLEQRERVDRLGVLAEHDDAHVGVALPQERRDPDALVAHRRRHADVGQHDVGRLGLDRLEQRRKVRVRADNLDLRLAGEHLLDALPDEKAVVRDDDPDRHVSTILNRVVGTSPRECMRAPRRTPVGNIAAVRPGRRMFRSTTREGARTLQGSARGWCHHGRRPGGLPRRRARRDRGDGRLRAPGRSHLRRRGARARRQGQS